MKAKKLYASFLLITLFTACGGGGGGGGACGPNPLNGLFADLAAEEGIQLNNCTFGYTNTVSGCTISGSYPYSETAIGSMNISISSSTSCGSIPSTASCSYVISTSDQFSMNCPDLGINDTFYRL